MKTAKQCRTRKTPAILLSAALALGMLPLAACGKKEPAHHNSTEIVEQPSPVADEQSVAEKEEPGEKADTEAAALKNAVKDIVSEYGGTQSVTYIDLQNGDYFRINGNERIASASMIKLLILAELFQQADDGKVDLGESMQVSSSDIVGGTGVIQGRGSGAYSIKELAHLMIAESDNTATNVLIDLLGMDAINKQAVKLGLEQTVLARKMMDMDARSQGRENYTCANDLAVILELIGKNELVGSKYSKLAKEFLLDQSDNEGLAQGVSGARFGHKTGTLDNQRHDGGIAYVDGKGTYVLVVMTQGMAQGTADSMMSRIAKEVGEKR